MIIQFCGLSGSGKTTIALQAKQYFAAAGINIDVIDGDAYRSTLCADLGFSKEDRQTNIRRLAFIAGKLAEYDIIPIICAINPYDKIRKETASSYPNVYLVYIKCSLPELIRRDTKGLYKRALLPQKDEHKINNLSGVNDCFEPPLHPHLIIETDTESVEASSQKLIHFLKTEMAKEKQSNQLIPSKLRKKV